MIHTRRKTLGMTQEQLAEFVGIGQQSLSRMEQGIIAPKFERLQQFADALNCRVVDTASGTLELNISTTNPEFAKISINTAYLNSQGTPHGCKIHESCIIKEDVLICPIGKNKYLSDNMDDPDVPYCKNHDCILKINRVGNTLEVEYSRFWRTYCSMNGVFDGKFIKKTN